MYFKEIETIYNEYTLQLYGRRIRLIYNIYQYQKLKNQDENYIKRLRKQKIKVKLFKHQISQSKVESCYYKLYARKFITKDNRLRIMSNILDSKVHGISVRDYITYKNENKNSIKTKNDVLQDTEETILDVLATYYEAGLVKHHEILIPEDVRYICKYEVKSLDNLNNKINKQEENYDDILDEDNSYKGDHKWEIRKLSSDDYDKWKSRNINQYDRWINSKTYKLNNLFSYDNGLNDLVLWNWLKNDWTNYENSYYIHNERLIKDSTYKAKWCYIDTENNFYFENDLYKLSDDIKQYEVGSDNECDMDHILVLEQDGKRYFFDENIDQIDNDKIMEVK